jgi:superfamily I DNA/RNA helicase
VVVDEKAALLDLIANVVKKKEDLHRVAIIGPTKRRARHHNANGNIGLQSVRNALLNAGISVNAGYLLGDAMDKTEDFKVREGQLNLMTIHSTKGLEFEHVILLDFHAKLLNRAS